VQNVKKVLTVSPVRFNFKGAIQEWISRSTKGASVCSFPASNKRALALCVDEALCVFQPSRETETNAKACSPKIYLMRSTL
jgi:hypothetical protein